MPEEVLLSVKWFNFRWRKNKGPSERRKMDRCSTEINGGRESLCWHLVGSARKKIRVERSELRREWRQWDMEQTGVVLKALQLIDRMRACLAIQGRVSRHWRRGRGYRTCLIHIFFFIVWKYTVHLFVHRKSLNSCFDSVCGGVKQVTRTEVAQRPSGSCNLRRFCSSAVSPWSFDQYEHGNDIYIYYLNLYSHQENNTSKSF